MFMKVCLLTIAALAVFLLPFVSARKYQNFAINPNNIIIVIFFNLYGYRMYVLIKFFNVYNIDTCTRRPGSLVTDGWCKSNCRDGEHPACSAVSGDHQQCTCSNDQGTIVIFAKFCFKFQKALRIVFYITIMSQFRYC